jgi:hypothetical protein
MSRHADILDPEVARDLAELDAALAGEPGADRALALLASDLRAEAPRMSAAFAARLDERVEAGFPRARPERRGQTPLIRGLTPLTLLARLRAGRTHLLPALGVAATLLVGVVVIGLVGRGDGGGAPTDQAAPSATGDTQLAVPSEDSGAAGATPERDAQAGAPSAILGAPPQSKRSGSGKPGFGRKVEKSAQLTLTTSPDDVQDVADGVVRVTQEVGGIVSGSSITTTDGQGSAQFRLRIPTRRLDDAIRRLSRLAHVGSLSQNGNDITEPFISAASRLSDALSERKALLRALGKATTAAQIESLRARLRANRSEIAAYKGELNGLRRRADFANVEVAVEGTGKKRGGTGGWTPEDALHDAVRVLEVAAGVALVGLAVLLPFALLGALGGLAARATRRRRREQALDTA